MEKSLLEVTINQGRPTMRFMEEETELRREACMVKSDCGCSALHLLPALNSNFRHSTVSACIMHSSKIMACIAEEAADCVVAMCWNWSPMPHLPLLGSLAASCSY